MSNLYHFFLVINWWVILFCFAKNFTLVFKSHFFFLRVHLCFCLPLYFFSFPVFLSLFPLYSFCLQGPNRVLSVPAVLAGLPSLHWHTARETSVAAGAAQPCRRSAASSDHGPVGAVLWPVLREMLLHQQHHQGEVLETPSPVPWAHRQQGKAQPVFIHCLLPLLNPFFFLSLKLL